MNTAHNGALDILKQSIGHVFTTSPSPFGRWLAPTVIAASEESLCLGYEVREEMCNPGGILHGGVSAAVSDDAIGATVICSGWARRFATIHATIEYYAPAKRGQRITATTALTHRSTRLLSAECTIRVDDGKLLACAASRLMRLSEG
jgi:acyl-coenzyme A thioesterase 13